MKKPGMITAGALMLAVMVVVMVYGMGRGGGMMGGMMRGMMGGSMERHRYAMFNGLPGPYENLANPLPATPRNIAEGRRIYSYNCAACHGETARGDGIVARNINPPPADLVSALGMHMTTDAYLYWSISEGGRAFESVMPPFKTLLSETERWQTITFLKQL